MSDENEEASQEGQSVSPLFKDEEPPQEIWATYKIKKNGKVVESFKVPFTQEELDLIMFLKRKENDPDLLRGTGEGGPERAHRAVLTIPYEHGLDSRKYVLDKLKKVLVSANKILESGQFSSHLNARGAVQSIRDTLIPFFPQED